MFVNCCGNRWPSKSSSSHCHGLFNSWRCWTRSAYARNTIARCFNCCTNCTWWRRILARTRWDLRCDRLHCLLCAPAWVGSSTNRTCRTITTTTVKIANHWHSHRLHRPRTSWPPHKYSFQSTLPISSKVPTIWSYLIRTAAKSTMTECSRAHWKNIRTKSIYLAANIRTKRLQHRHSIRCWRVFWFRRAHFWPTSVYPLCQSVISKRFREPDAIDT